MHDKLTLFGKLANITYLWFDNVSLEQNCFLIIFPYLKRENLKYFFALYAETIN